MPWYYLKWTVCFDPIDNIFISKRICLIFHTKIFDHNFHMHDGDRISWGNYTTAFEKNVVCFFLVCSYRSLRGGSEVCFVRMHYPWPQVHGILLRHHHGGTLGTSHAVDRCHRQIFHLWLRMKMSASAAHPKHDVSVRAFREQTTSTTHLLCVKKAAIYSWPVPLCFMIVNYPLVWPLVHRRRS